MKLDLESKKYSELSTKFSQGKSKSNAFLMLKYESNGTKKFIICLTPGISISYRIFS